MAKRKKGLKGMLTFLLTFAFTVTLGFFVWLTWKLIADWIGSSVAVWAIAGGIVVVGIVGGFFSIKKIIKRFM